MKRPFIDRSTRMAYQHRVRDFLAGVGGPIRALAYPVTGLGEYRYLRSHPLDESGERLYDYCLRTRSLFIHIPKAAGMSVSAALYGTQVGHYRFRDIELLFSPKVLNELFKFTFVRCPIDRFASAFYFLKAGGLTQEDSDWAKRYLGQFDSLNQFITEGVAVAPKKYTRYIHFRPQYEFLCNSEGRIAMDFVGRFENIAEDFRTLGDRLGTHVTLPKINVTGTSPARRTISAEAAQVLRRVYCKDFGSLGY